ncbi:hypothetical protein Tco_0535643 [Tanacetum coccineum]
MRTRSQARISVPEPPVRQPSVESSNLDDAGPNGVKSERRHIVLIGDLNGVSIALVARSGIISQNRIDAYRRIFKALFKSATSERSSPIAPDAVQQGITTPSPQ